MNKFCCIIFLFVVIFYSDAKAFKTDKKKLNKTNFKELYSEKKFTKFGAAIYHISDEKSKVYLDISLNELKYLTSRDKQSHFARFSIFYELFSGYDSKAAIDTATLLFDDSLNYGTTAGMVIDFEIKAHFPGDYILKITLTDLNRTEDNSIFNLYRISKTNKNTSQYFLLVDENNHPLFVKHFDQGQYFKIMTNHVADGQLYVRYYNRKLPVARTPFSLEKPVLFKFRADSLYTINLTGGQTDLLQLPFKGIYHFQTDTNQTEGFTLFHFDDGFPEIETPLQAILPLRYLTTQKEFNTLLQYSDFKVAVDSFWLERASGHTERAKNMIAKYYQRVVFANQVFTSYQEGWKTDRGMIYIIYGPPTEVFRKLKQEHWIYGERGNPLTINFFFDEVENPFTFDDYSLQRSSTYKSSWYIAIENWRR